MMNPCIFTGAQVRLIEYDALICCDVFYYSGILVFTGFDKLVFSNEWNDRREKVLATLDANIYIEDGFFKRPQNFILVRKDLVGWTDKGWKTVKLNLSYEGIETL